MAKYYGYCEVCLDPLELPPDFNNDKQVCYCDPKTTKKGCKIILDLFRVHHSDKAYAVRQFFDDWQKDQRRLPPP